MTAASATLVSLAKCGFETLRLDITQAAWPSPGKKKVNSTHLIDKKSTLECETKTRRATCLGIHPRHGPLSLLHMTYS